MAYKGEGVGQFFDLRGALIRKGGVVILMEEVVNHRTLLYVYVYFLNNFLSLFINKNLFFSFPFFFFMMKYQIFATEYWTFKNYNR